MEVIASIFNGLSLIGIVALIMYTAYARFLHPETINAGGTIAFAAIAVGLNLISSRVLSGSQAQLGRETEDQNITSTQKHIIGDAMASLAVIVGATAVYFTGLTIIDPIVAVFIGLIVLRSAIKITMQGSAIILERSPIKNMPQLEQNLLRVSGISDVHDFHAWRICSHITVASMHACLNSSGKNNPMLVRRDLESKLNESGVQHVTIQFEDECCVPSHAHRDS